MLQQYQHILVAIDGSYEAELAFKKAVAVAKRNQAELILIHIVDTQRFKMFRVLIPQWLNKLRKMPRPPWKVTSIRPKKRD